MILLLEETAQDDRFNPEAMAASNSSARIDPAIVVGFHVPVNDWKNVIYKTCSESGEFLSSHCTCRYKSNRLTISTLCPGIPRV